ncbi:hypothetical protein [Paenibacillus sedimenti]|uniref:Uncharacterized protein n=1 Tax=Paenibacillus sedimenti TaxID=2770274 RepID=A0A926KQH7_9BACL|nr:hypothetical protein [Paenibacillus sedimenti]MBD0382202.1 hypothetical protein [Paenibacillus sedimenti]
MIFKFGKTAIRYDLTPSAENLISGICAADAFLQLKGVGWCSYYNRMAPPNVFFHVLNPF